MEHGKSTCAECTRLIRLCSGLDYFPADVEVRKLLIERLHATARNHQHAEAMIQTWLNSQTAAPKVANIIELAGTVKSSADSLPAGCDACHGEPWVIVPNPEHPGWHYLSVARRCSCARGQALRSKDRQREEERQSKAAA